MTRFIRLLSVFLLVLSLAPPLFAGETFHPKGTMLRKLERGGANLLLGELEFLYHLRQPDRGEFFPPWMIGIGKSLYYSVRRNLVGVYEIVTFPVPYPSGYEPVIQPEFVWQYPPRKK